MQGTYADGDGHLAAADEVQRAPLRARLDDELAGHVEDGADLLHDEDDHLPNLGRATAAA